MVSQEAGFIGDVETRMKSKARTKPLLIGGKNLISRKTENTSQGVKIHALGVFLDRTWLCAWRFRKASLKGFFPVCFLFISLDSLRLIALGFF